MKSTKKLIEEIHAAVVGGAVINEELVGAAKAVVEARKSQIVGWDGLKNAIAHLGDVLERTKA